MSDAAKTSTLAIIALVCAIFCQPLGLILGIIALVQISNSNGAMKGKGLAIAAIVVGGLMFVVGILAAIAIPNFIRYQQRSKQAEAKFTLSAVSTAQEAFRAEMNQYITTTPDGGAMGSLRGTWEGRACDAACGPTNLDACREFDCIGYSSQGSTYHQFACNAVVNGDDPKYTCVAVGDLDGDGDESVWVIGNGAPLPAIAVEAGCVSAEASDRPAECKPGTF